MSLLKNRYLWVGVCLAMVTGALYLPVIQAPFLFDDYSSIVENPSIRSLDFQRIYAFKPLRVVGYLTFALNFYFDRLNTLPYHLVNIGIHLLYGIFCFLFVDTLMTTPSGRAMAMSRHGRRRLALASAAIVLLHPMNVFAVSYVVQRLASLAACLYVACLFCYLKARLSPQMLHKALWGAGCGVLLVTGLFTKENVFTIFIQFFFIEWLCFEWTSHRKKGFAIFCLLVAACAWLLVQKDIVDLNEISRMTLETTEISRLEYLYTQFSVVCFYLTSFLVPTGLALAYDRDIFTSMTDPRVFVPGLFLLSVFGLITWWTVLRRFRVAAYGLLFYFAAISIESSVIPIRDTVFLHRTYLPNLGMAWAVLAAGYLGVKRWKTVPPGAVPLHKVALTALGIWLLMLSGVTWQTNMILRSPVTAWQRVLEVSPGFLRAYLALGNLYVNSSDPADHPKARPYIMTIHAHFPDDVQNLNNMGIMLNREGKYVEAAACYERLIAQDKRQGNAYANLGATYVNLNQYDKALAVLEKGANADPNNFTVLINYGQMLAILGQSPAQSQGNQGDRQKQAQLEAQNQKALAVLERAARINPDHPAIYYARGIAWFNLGDPDQAKENFRKVLALDPSFEEARQFLSNIE